MRFKTLALLSLLLLACWTKAYAQEGDDPEPEPLILSGDQSEYPLGTYLELLEDPGSELTIEDVTSPGYETQFAVSEEEVPNFGFTDSAYWVRLRLRDENPAIDSWLLEMSFNNMHFVDLYSPLADGDGYEVRQTGAMRPPSSRDILHPHFVFELTTPDQNEQTYYLRFKNGASMTLPLTLWQKAAFFEQSLQRSALEAVFLGIMIGLLGYNLFLFVSLRDVNYLYLALLISSFVLYDLGDTGLIEIYIDPELYRIKQHLISLSSAAIMIMLIMFNDSFLSLETNFPNVHRLNLLLIGFAVVLGLATYFVSYHNIAAVYSPSLVFILVMIMVTVIIAWQRGVPATRFLVIAWIGLVAGVLLFVLGRMGVISNTFIIENAYHFGFVWMAICSSLALADRVNLLKAETESANRDLQESEHRLSQTLEAMPVGVVVYGPDQKRAYVNTRTADILSNPTQEMGPDLSTGRTLDEAMADLSFRVAGSDQAYPLEAFPVYRALQGDSSSADDIEADLGLKRVPLELWGSPVFDNGGNVESAVIAFQDISERKQHEAELEGYRHHLEQLVLERTEELNIINEQLTAEMAERAVLEGLLHKRIQWMSVLALARQRIKGLGDLPMAYERLSRDILGLLDAGSLFLIRWREGVEQVEFLCRPMYRDSEPDSEAIRASFEVGSSLRQELETAEIIVFSADEVSSMPEPICDCFLGSGMQSLLLAPMVTEKSVTGVLGLALSLPRQELSTAQKELISKVILDLGGLAQEARFLDQSRALVASEERNRLARDLHDSVTQVLFSASLVAEVLPQIWQRDPNRALQSLEELRRLTRGALAEMRTMLLELRPAAVAKSPLPELLAQLTEASTSRVQLPFRLFIEQTPPLPKDVHAAIYRIAQEALNNVAKHARAGKVTLSFGTVPLTPQQTAGKLAEKMVGVRLVVEDDGVGFSPEDKGVKHLGLGIMRERAADIGSELDIESRIGEGTRVTLDWCGVMQDGENET